MKLKALAVSSLFLGFAGVYFARGFSPVTRLGLASVGLLFVIKVAALLWQVSDGAKFRSKLGLAAFLFAWPGVSVDGFTVRKSLPPPKTGERFFEAWLTFAIGAFLLLLASLLGRGGSTLFNYLALFSVLLIIHLGLIEVIADGLRLLGLSPGSLFDRPFLAASLRDFWSLRWNRAFVEMNKILLFDPLRGRVPRGALTFSIFLISGLLHELGISFADGVSWGKPFLYFALQGIGMEVEKKRPLPRYLVWVWILLPAPLLFTPAFTNLFLGGLGHAIFVFMTGVGRESAIRYGLLAGGALQLLVLCASIQVPGKLRWREEFQKLQPLNRKAFWTYGAYIFSIIFFMAVTSLFLSTQAGSWSLLLWVVFISLFWWARVMIDLFYMSPSDWPKGPVYVIGHVCLTTLFISLAVLYSAVAAMTLNGAGL